MSKKSRIAVLADWFAPGFRAGGPTRSCVNFVRFFERDYEVYVLTTDTDLGTEQPYPEIAADTWTPFSTYAQVYYFSKTQRSYKGLLAQLQAIQPDFIYINSMFSLPFTIWPLWMLFRGQLASQVVLAPRGMLKASALAFKSFKKKPFLWLMKVLGLAKQLRFHATNIAEQAEIEAVFGPTNIHVAVNLPYINREAWQELPKIQGAIDLIFLARIHPIKNLYFLLQCLQNIKEGVKVNLSIIGPMEDEAYWQRCQTLIDAFPAHVTASYKGAVPYEETRKLLQAHHLMALPTQGENFGHAIFDSLSAGRPVLISDQTPWKDLEQQHAGWELRLDTPKAFSQAIETMAAMDQATYNQWAQASWQYAQDFLAQTPLKQQYQAIFS